MADKILVLNGNSYGAALEGLGVLSFDKKEFMSKPDDFKLVQFTGGEDVSPSFYGDTSPKGLCHNSMHRDIEEKETTHTYCIRNKKDQRTPPPIWPTFSTTWRSGAPTCARAV